MNYSITVIDLDTYLPQFSHGVWSYEVSLSCMCEEAQCLMPSLA